MPDGFDSADQPLRNGRSSSKLSASGAFRDCPRGFLSLHWFGVIRSLAVKPQLTAWVLTITGLGLHFYASSIRQPFSA
jgi:hypothetical protein